MITYLVTAFASGPLGLVVNHFGRRRYFIMGTTIIFFVAHCIIWLTSQCPNPPTVEYSAIWGLFLLGIGFSFYANCIVAAIPLCVKKKVVGTAFSIMEIISSLAEFVVPLWTGALVESAETTENGFKSSSFVFVMLGLSAIIVSISLHFVDKRMKKRLDRS